MNFLTADVALVVDASKLPAQLARAERAAKKTATSMTKSFQKMGTSFKAVFTKMARIAKWASVVIVAALTLTAKAAMKQEDAIFMLNAALKISGEYTDELAQEFKDFAAQIQKTTIYGDEFVLGLMQQQRSLGVTADKLEEAAKMAIGLATATGRGIESMSMYVALAFQGEFTMLRRYIPALRSTTDATEQLAIVTKFAADGFKLAEEQAKTTSGKLKQLWNTLGDIAEILGAPLLRPLAEWSDKLKGNRKLAEHWAEGWAKGIENVIEWFIRWKKQIGYTVAALAGLFIISKITGLVLVLRTAILALAGAFGILGTAISYNFSVLLGFITLSGSWGVGILSFLGLMKIKLGVIPVALAKISATFIGVTAAVSLAGAAIYKLTGISNTFKEGFKDYWKDYLFGLKEALSYVGRLGKAIKESPARFFKEARERREYLALLMKEREQGFTYPVGTPLGELEISPAKAQELAKMAAAKFLAPKAEPPDKLDFDIPSLENQEAMSRIAKHRVEKQRELNSLLLDEVKLHNTSLGNYDEMMRALQFEYDFLGKTNDERERGLAAAAIEREIENMTGVDRNKLMEDYLNLLQRVQDKQNSISHTLKLWTNDAVNWGKNLGEVLTNAFDKAAENFADMLMQQEVDWKAFGRMFVKELMVMIIKLQMARVLLSFFPGLAPAPIPVTLVPSAPVGLQHGGEVERTGWAKVHKGEVFSGVNNEMGLGSTVVNISDYVGVDIEVDEYKDSDQRIVDVSLRAAAGDGTYRRAHRLG